MTTPIYLCDSALAEQTKIQGEESVYGHQLLAIKNRTIVWPNRFHESCISPKSILSLKVHLKSEKLILVDRVFPLEETIKISNHSNRSGMSFLRGKTPYKEFPTFPDVSNVYEFNGGETVVTVGPARFGEKKKNENELVSESLAPIAVVWHYIGVKLQAFGCIPKILNLSQLIKDIDRLA